jgi:hypothetical protein
LQEHGVLRRTDVDEIDGRADDALKVLKESEVRIAAGFGRSELRRVRPRALEDDEEIEVTFPGACRAFCTRAEEVELLNVALGARPCDCLELSCVQASMTLIVPAGVRVFTLSPRSPRPC